MRGQIYDHYGPTPKPHKPYTIGHIVARTNPEIQAVFRELDEFQKGDVDDIVRAGGFKTIFSEMRSIAFHPDVLGGDTAYAEDHAGLRAQDIYEKKKNKDKAFAEKYGPLTFGQYRKQRYGEFMTELLTPLAKAATGKPADFEEKKQSLANPPSPADEAAWSTHQRIAKEVEAYEKFTAARKKDAAAGRDDSEETHTLRRTVIRNFLKENRGMVNSLIQAQHNFYFTEEKKAQFQTVDASPDLPAATAQLAAKEGESLKTALADYQDGTVLKKPLPAPGKSLEI